MSPIQVITWQHMAWSQTCNPDYKSNAQTIIIPIKLTLVIQKTFLYLSTFKLHDKNFLKCKMYLHDDYFGTFVTLTTRVYTHTSLMAILQLKINTVLVQEVRIIGHVEVSVTVIARELAGDELQKVI